MARVALTTEQKTKEAQKKLTENCKRQLAAYGVTHQQVADYVGCTRQEISYELNHVLSFKAFVAICQLLGKELPFEKKVM